MIPLYQPLNFALQALWIPVTVDDKDSAQSEENVELVRGMTGIFLGGGDPWRLAEALMVTEAGASLDSPVMAAIREKWETGGLVAGTSAGIMAMTSSQVITGGDSWESLVWGASQDSSMDSDVSGNLTYDALAASTSSRTSSLTLTSVRGRARAGWSGWQLTWTWREDWALTRTLALRAPVLTSNVRSLAPLV